MIDFQEGVQVTQGLDFCEQFQSEIKKCPYSFLDMLSLPCMEVDSKALHQFAWEIVFQFLSQYESTEQDVFQKTSIQSEPMFD